MLARAEPGDILVALFGPNTGSAGNVIDWDLIAKHWTDLLRTAISIREGRVIRTITLLRYLSEPELREQITAITNRAEAFHGYSE